MYSTKNRAKRIGAREEGMAMKRYRVKLSTEERQELKTLVSRGRAGGLPADPRPSFAAER